MAAKFLFYKKCNPNNNKLTVKTKFKERLCIYLEIVVASVVWFGLMVGAAFVFRSIEPKLFDSWVGGVLIFIVAVLPYLVVSSLAWGVPLGAMGAKAEKAAGDAGAPALVVDRKDTKNE